MNRKRFSRGQPRFFGYDFCTPALYAERVNTGGSVKQGPGSFKWVLMHISAEMFESIIRGIRGDGGDEKRKHPRVGLSGRITIAPLPPAKNQKPTTVAVRDLSPGGIGILHSQAFRPGEQFNLILKYDKSETTKTILCTVRWSRSVGSDLYAIGAQFEKGDAEPAKSPEKPKAGE